jgi:hypothetical protein
MPNCSNTGLAMPECACAGCLQRQLEQFAPEHIRVRRQSAPASHSPMTLMTSRLSRRPSNSA